MKKIYFINLALVIILFWSFNILLYISGNTIGANMSDFINQHMLFIDYLRQNFHYSHDFFPQLNMNMGLGQSMVSLYYHGLYNIFVLLTYILPFDNVLKNMLVIWNIVFLLNALFMTKLLRLNKIDDKINTIVTLIFCFSTSLVYHMSWHVMFVYYMPFLILSLIGIHYLVDKKIKSIYIIGFALVFYTNFFFAPIVSVVQFLYYLGLLEQSNKLSLKNIIIFFKPYLIGVLLGMFILIPVFLFGVGSRTSEDVINNSYHIFNNIPNMLNDITWEKYSSFFLFATLFSIVGTFISLKEKRFYVMMIPMVLIMLFNHLNLFLNVFQYTHSKIYIYMIPIFVVTLASILQKKEKLAQVLIISIAIGLVDLFIKHFSLNAILLGILAAVLFTFIVITKNRVRLFFAIVLITVNFFQTSNFIAIADGYKYNQNNEEAKSFENARSNKLSKYNKIDSITSQNPQIYTSLENSNYLNFLRYDIEVEKSGMDRQVSTDLFDNFYLKNYLGIVDENIVDENGIFYGVDSSNTCSIKDYEALEPLERSPSLNECTFVSNSQNEYESKFDIQKIYSSTDSFSVDKDLEVEVPEDYSNGLISISFNADYDKLGTKGYIKINDHRNDLKYSDFYGLYNNQQITFLIDTNKYDILNISSSYIKNEEDDKPFSNLNVYYQSLEDFNNNKMETYAIDNFEVDINNSYSFTIDMPENGYLATSIPYDKGFKLYVDGAEKDIEKINGRFIGSNINKGKHDIKLVYHIVGFNVGASLTGFALIILFYVVYKDFKRLK